MRVSTVCKVRSDLLTMNSTSSSGQWGSSLTFFHMQNPDTVKKALLQTILALKDATSHPWPAVRAAYGTSMHEVELGNLSWGDQMQWAINRLSALQIAMANTHISLNKQNHRTKICKGLTKVCVLLNHTTDSTSMFVLSVRN